MMYFTHLCRFPRFGSVITMFPKIGLQVQSTKLVRNCSTKLLPNEQTPVTTSELETDSDLVTWNTIYHFPGIMLTASIKRLRMYPIGLTAVSVPASIGLAYADVCSLVTAQICGSVGLATTLTLLLFGYFTNNLVGYVYTDEKLGKVKISYVDLHGKRQNRIYLVDDIVPRTEFEKSLLKFYFPIKNHDNGEVYKIIHRYGEIYDTQAFSAVFGKEHEFQ
ncbi:transmembrane protein 186 [Topomyia yanbarensis]|uniref:transmembrane protein 186 n=1 Tax=Topomyia yanbarensis TaxID=2498891 RepID=UPI00273CAF0B|nr:transmembrane protein 186 [Topomyia yanbarensis]